ncbi:MAG: CRISPR-associated endonuclease Cas2 [Chloroflexota bacterium]
MFWVVCYDIVDDRRRRRVMKTLEGFGRRVQYSVFECDLDNLKILRLEMMLRRVIDEQEDNIRFYPMNEADLQKVKLLGNAILERIKGHYVV